MSSLFFLQVVLSSERENLEPPMALAEDSFLPLVDLCIQWWCVNWIHFIPCLIYFQDGSSKTFSFSSPACEASKMIHGLIIVINVVMPHAVLQCSHLYWQEAWCWVNKVVFNVENEVVKQGRETLISPSPSFLPQQNETVNRMNTGIQLDINMLRWGLDNCVLCLHSPHLLSLQPVRRI